MQLRPWINRQLFLLALTAAVLYIAAPVTDILTLYAMDILAGRADAHSIRSDAGKLLSSFGRKSRSFGFKGTINRDIGQPVDVNIDSLSTTRKNIFASAHSYLGTIYKRGGNTRSGIDCSGLVQQVFRQEKISLPRTANRQYREGQPISRRELLPGDLIFFLTEYDRPPPTHVGIYVGNNHFIHAPKPGSVVKTSSINRPYFRKSFYGARRVVPES